MKLIKLTCVLLMTAWVSSANATLIFDFSFTDTVNGGGVVTGEIIGLMDNATSSATSVRILSNTLGFGIGEYASPASSNLFEVLDGVITSYIFKSTGTLNFMPFVTDSTFLLLGNSVGLANHTNTVSTTTLAAQSFTATLRGGLATVPEPGTVILMSLGMAGLFASRNRKNS